MITVEFLRTQLELNGRVLFNMLKNMNAQLYNWKPNAKAWSILEILCHLTDEEKEDFKVRMKYAIDKQQAPHMIDPVGWVTQRNYSAQDFDLKLQEFKAARNDSIAWLEDIEDSQFEHKWVHPKLGPLTAHHFAANWLAHDQLHIRQITRNKYNYIQQLSKNNCEYAGNW